MSTHGDKRAEQVEATCSSDPMPWPGAEKAINGAIDIPGIQRALFEGLTRGRQITEDVERVRKAGEKQATAAGDQARILGLMLAQSETIFSRLGSIMARLDDADTRADLTMALLQGIAAKLGVTANDVEALHDAERERRARDTATAAAVARVTTRVETVERAQERLGHSAEDSSQRAAVTAAMAVDALAAERRANIEAARAEARADVERDARKSVATEMTVKITEGRVWALDARKIVLGAIATGIVGGVGALISWLVTRWSK